MKNNKSTIINPEEQLQKVLSQNDDSKDTVDLLNDIANRFAFEGNKKSLEATTEAYKIAQKISYSKGVVNCLATTAYYYWMTADLDEAMEKLGEAIKLLNMSENSDNNEGKAHCFGTLSGVELSLGNYESSLSYAFKSLRLFEKIADKTMTALSLSRIGKCYNEIGDYDAALDYNSRSREMLRNLNDPVFEARALVGIGTSHQKKGDMDKALEFHLEGLQIFESANNNMGIARSLIDIGSVYHQNGDYKRALEYYEKSLALRKKTGQKQAQSTSLISIGRLYLDQDNIVQAEKVLKQALAISSEIKAKPRMYAAHEKLFEVYERKGDTAQALHHHKLFQKIKEEVFSSESNARIKNFQINLEVEKSEKESEIRHLRELQKIELEKNRIEAEINIAHEIQANLVPDIEIDHERFIAYGKSIAASEVGGDFIDAVDLGNNKYAFAIGDVSGHNVGAGILMAITKSALRTEFKYLSTLENLAGSLNTTITANSEKQMFVTVMVGILDLEKNELNIVNAGHHPLFHYRKNDNKISEWNPDGIALGLSEKTDFKAETISWSSGDVFLFFTDGLSEAANGKFEEFGEERIRSSMSIAAMDQSPDNIYRTIMKDLNTYSGSKIIQDDISILCLKIV